TWNVSAPWSTASSRWSRRPIRPPAPSIAAMRSIQTAVGSSATAEPPGSEAALADHSGFTYTLAPAYGLSTRSPGGSVLGGGSVGPVEPVQTVPFSVKLAGAGLEPE